MAKGHGDQSGVTVTRTIVQREGALSAAGKCHTNSAGDGEVQADPCSASQQDWAGCGAGYLRMVVTPASTPAFFSHKAGAQ